MLREVLTASSLTFLLLSIALNAAVVGMRSSAPQPSRRRDTTTVEAACDPNGHCIDNNMRLFVSAACSRPIGPESDSALSNCSGDFARLTYAKHFKNRFVYERVSSGPYACGCLAYCNQQIRDCSGNYEPFQGWLLMLPAVNPQASCSCQNAIMPVESQGLCKPSSNADSLVLGVLRESSTCLTSEAPLDQAWQTWDVTNASFASAPMTLLCSPKDTTEECLTCADSCAARTPTDCTFVWPPRCSDGGIECSYDCGDASMTLTSDLASSCRGSSRS